MVHDLRIRNMSTDASVDMIITISWRNLRFPSHLEYIITICNVAWIIIWARDHEYGTKVSQDRPIWINSDPCFIRNPPPPRFLLFHRQLGGRGLCIIHNTTHAHYNYPGSEKQHGFHHGGWRHFSNVRPPHRSVGSLNSFTNPWRV